MASEILDEGLQQCALAHFGWTDDGHDDRRRFHGRPVDQRNVLRLRLEILRPVETFLGLEHRLDGESFRVALLGILFLDVRILGLLLLRFASFSSKIFFKKLFNVPSTHKDSRLTGFTLAMRFLLVFDGVRHGRVLVNGEPGKIKSGKGGQRKTPNNGPPQSK